MTAVLDRGLARAADLLDGLGDLTDLHRREVIGRHRNALGLMRELNPELGETAALRLIADELEYASTHPGTRVVISIPPQEGKTTLVRRAVMRKLQRHPDLLNAVVSYEVNLARDTGREVRELIDAHGSRAVDAATGEKLPDRLGIAVRQNHAAAGDWTLAGHAGGVYSIGVRGGLTGHPVTGLFVVDDPLKDMEAADSEAVRRALHSWWTSVSEARLGPQTSIVIIQTRWHEDDLAGRLIAADEELPADEREWRVINIPALADGDTHDSLAGVPGGRTDDGYLVSARGRTPDDWRRIRRRVGERVWAALYQGRPAPLEGGIFQRAWVDAHRVRELPDDVDQTVVAVDPAETGVGDAAGILVGHRARSGHTYTSADLSGQLTQAQWGRKVCLTAVRVDAHSIAQERNLGMSRVLPDAWQVLRRQATALKRASGNVAAALGSLAAAGDTVAAERAQLDEVAPLVDAILERPSVRPCRISMINPRVSKQARAEGITGYYELGVTHHVGTLPMLEHEMFTWQPGQPSPNRLDTLALLLTQLDTYSAQKGRRARTGDTPRTRSTVPSSTPTVFRPGFR